MGLFDDFKNALDQGVSGALPTLQAEVTRRLDEQIRPAVVQAPQPTSTMTVAQAQAQTQSSKLITFAVIGAAAVAVYFIFKKRGK